MKKFLEISGVILVGIYVAPSLIAGFIVGTIVRPFKEGFNAVMKAKFK